MITYNVHHNPILNNDTESYICGTFPFFKSREQHLTIRWFFKGKDHLIMAMLIIVNNFKKKNLTNGKKKFNL
jgi:hypothetical protein